GQLLIIQREPRHPDRHFAFLRRRTAPPAGLDLRLAVRRHWRLLRVLRPRRRGVPLHVLLRVLLLDLQLLGVDDDVVVEARRVHRVPAVGLLLYFPAHRIPRRSARGWPSVTTGVAPASTRAFVAFSTATYTLPRDANRSTTA